jgi:hydroxyacylglutathione hydrolase
MSQAIMEIHAVPCLSDNYAYIIASGGSAVVVDPSEAAPVQAALDKRSLALVGIWATHHHHDHVGGIAELVEHHAGLEVVGSAYDAEHGRIPGLTRSVADGEALWFGSHRARVIDVPGHTLGAVAFVIEGAVFSGDTLFGAGCGRLFEGTPAVMVSSLEKLRGLPGETQLYCGHEYTVKNLGFAAQIEPGNPAVAERGKRVAALRQAGKPSVPSTIEEERATNPLLRWDAPAVVQKARELGAASGDGVEVFAALRRARDGF